MSRDTRTTRPADLAEQPRSSAPVPGHDAPTRPRPEAPTDRSALGAIQHPAPRILPNLIAVASGKGGVGKTFIAISLAHAFAARRIKTVLFDGDLGLANVDVQLGLTAQRDLRGVISGAWRMSEVATPYLAAGFDIIAGRSGVAGLSGLQPRQLFELREGLGELSACYRRVVLDLGAGVDRTVRYLSAPAGIVLVITNDEPTSLTDAYAFIKLAVGGQPQGDIRLVVNQAEGREDGRRTHAIIAKACRTFLGYQLPLAGIIRRDPKVPEAIRAQLPLMARSPGCRAAEDLEALAKTLLS